MKIITLPPQYARLNGVARVLAAFIAHLHTEASPKRKKFDPKQVCRLVMLAGVDLGSLTTPEGDALLAELLAEARRVEEERCPQPRRKGGAV